MADNRSQWHDFRKVFKTQSQGLGWPPWSFQNNPTEPALRAAATSATPTRRTIRRPPSLPVASGLHSESSTGGHNQAHTLSTPGGLGRHHLSEDPKELPPPSWSPVVWVVPVCCQQGVSHTVRGRLGPADQTRAPLGGSWHSSGVTQPATFAMLLRQGPTPARGHVIVLDLKTHRGTFSHS